MTGISSILWNSLSFSLVNEAFFKPIQRKQLLDLGVLQTFIRLAFEDERSTIRYPYSELTKLYSLVSILIRSCDVSKSMKSSVDVSTCFDYYFYPVLKYCLTHFHSIVSPHVSQVRGISYPLVVWGSLGA